MVPVEVSVGVQEQVATPPEVVLEPQPLIVLPPILKLTDPLMFAVAVKDTGLPYVAVEPPPGIEMFNTGFALATFIVTTYVFDAGDAAESVTVNVSTYVPTVIESGTPTTSFPGEERYASV